jgi:hypothetical protein
MQLPFTPQKLPYSREVLADHVSMIGDLIGKRERSLQIAILKQSDVQQQKYLKEVDLYDQMIQTAQRSMNFMLDKNLRFIKLPDEGKG